MSETFDNDEPVWIESPCLAEAAATATWVMGRTGPGNTTMCWTWWRAWRAHHADHVDDGMTRRNGGDE